jgi:hypothetical protein
MTGKFYVWINEDPETTNYYKSNDIRKIIHKIEDRENAAPDSNIEWQITNYPDDREKRYEELP